MDDRDLKELYSFFDSLKSIEYIPDYLHSDIPKGLNLGAMSTSYTSLVQQFEEFQLFLRQSAVFVKIKALSNEIEQIKRLNQSLTKQENFFEKDVALTEKDFGRHTILREQGVIADLEKKKQNQRFSMKRETLRLFVLKN
ncbi:MAG: hypothetical protein IPO26_04535 [Saprospiraceae bacterium]|nr:hypothetical protein [Saprospiraceae bacterium]